MLIAQPDCGEQALSMVDTLIRSGSLDVVVVDSVSKMLRFLKNVMLGVDCQSSLICFF